MTLLKSLQDFCQRYGKKQGWVALSGGLDSRVLLDACHTIRQAVDIQFRVIHVHHGLSPNADAWAQFCETLCHQYGFDFQVVHLNLQNPAGVSLEETARDARYQVFASVMQTDDLLLTAHHQDDQAETVLTQLLRGAGPKGLSAMPALKPFASGWHGRPFLGCQRQEIQAYAEAKNLQWIDDESNANCSFTRNFLRHDVMPILKNRWPGVDQALARSAAHCAEAQHLLEEMALAKLLDLHGSRPGTLSATKLLVQTEKWQRLLLRVWIEQHGYVLPDTNKLLSIQTSVLSSARDRTPCVSWAGVQVRRHRDDIHIIAEAPAEVDVLSGHCLRTDIGEVTVRFREPGETVEIGARGRVSLKNLFQEWQVPTWERGRLPLMFCENKLIQVPGYYLDTAYFF
jgi:tRNA(Ile)-lysidine synthase